MMGELLRNVVAVVLIAAGGLLLAYLVWITATSKLFLTIFVMSIADAVVALVLVVAVLAILGVLAWWIALLVVVLTSAALLVGIYPALTFGLSRQKTKLREGFPSHWHDGEASGKTAAERLTAPSSYDEAKRMSRELSRLTEEAHVRREHVDAEDQCLAFGIAFDDAFWDSLRASGSAPAPSPSLGHRFARIAHRHFRRR
jgi:ABC-type multidrug transport system fused ATPase/permease subunit